MNVKPRTRYGTLVSAIWILERDLPCDQLRIAHSQAGRGA